MAPVNGQELRDRCLSLIGSEEDFPFGPDTSVFKVAGRIFALAQLGESPLRVSVKCDPLLAEQLRAAHPAVMPGYHLNKRHWNTVTIDGSLADSDDRRHGRGLLRPDRQPAAPRRGAAPWLWRGDR